MGAGLLAIPVLGGATAYAVGEGRRWPVGLARKPKEAVAFYAVLALSAAIGIALNFTPINPISALYWSAVVNGVLAVPVMVLLMIMSRRKDVMGHFVIAGPRSEEHTSELQSHLNLVCRLLLEKKKQQSSELQSHLYVVCPLLLQKQKDNSPSI